MSTKVFGSAIKRREDPRLITGEAKYLDDIQLPGMLHAAVLRSPYAHAKIKGVNTKDGIVIFDLRGRDHRIELSKWARPVLDVVRVVGGMYLVIKN